MHSHRAGNGNIPQTTVFIDFFGNGADEGNRTPVCSLGSCRSTIELHPRSVARTIAMPSASDNPVFDLPDLFGFHFRADQV